MSFLCFTTRNFNRTFPSNDPKLCTVVKYGNNKEWEFLSMKYDELKGKRMGQAIQHGLSCTKD